MTLMTKRTPHEHAPVVFEEFFELGQEETVSPFIKISSRRWGANLSLKSALLAALFLVVSFALSFHPLTFPISAICLIFVYFLAGTPSLIESIEDLMNWDVNIDVLMTLAAFSSILIGSGMEGGLLLVLFALSHSMEDAVTSKAKGAISNLKRLAPTTVSFIAENDVIIERAAIDIQVGDRILIKSGEVVSLDGCVIEGISSVNLVHLTGENFPVTKKMGDIVPAGARNLEGALTLKVIHTHADSTLARIIQLVTQAQEARPTLQRWFDQLSHGYAITIIGLAFLFATAFPFLLNIPFLGIEGSIYRSLAFLIAASPCALIIAIPIAYLSAVSSCARMGILIKGGITLDALASCKGVALDKTGTLTTGDLQLTGEKPSIEALSIAYSMEKNAIHPIAKAIVAHAQKEKIQATPIRDFRALPGEGLEAIAGTVKVAIGHPEFIATKLSPALAKRLVDESNRFREQGELVAGMSLDEEFVLFRFQDTLRTNMRETIDKLQNKHKLDLVMLTGDHDQNARLIAEKLGIKKFFANLKPEDKLNYVSQIAKTQGLAMVGDGINDAPALARATVGICMGKVGHTAAMEAADVVLLQDNIEKLDWLFQKAKKTQAIVRENLILAAGAILIATIPALAGYIPLWLAVILHEGGTVLVGLNGLRLLRS